MTIHKDILSVIIMMSIGIISITTIIVISNYAYGAISLDSSNRREYTWCPIDDSTARTNIEINGCPLVRVYVNNWNGLTTLQKNTIDTKLRSLGFVDVGEHIIR